VAKLKLITFYLKQMELETENLNKTQNKPLLTGDVNKNAFLPNEQVVLYFQFDDNEPIESVKCNGKEFTLKMLPGKGGFVEFTDGKNKFRMFVRQCY
jgi:hypothetical protein